MKLYDILQQTMWLDVEKSIKIHYPEVKQIKKYKKVYFKLLELEPIIDENNDIQIIIHYNDLWFEVLGYSKKNNVLYGLEYVRWEDWLGFEVHPDVLNLPAPDVVAHCLVEMTYAGFTQEDIQKEANILIEVTKKLENEIKLNYTFNKNNTYSIDE